MNYPVHSHFHYSHQILEAVPKKTKKISMLKLTILTIGKGGTQHSARLDKITGSLK